MNRQHDRSAEVFNPVAFADRWYASEWEKFQPEDAKRYFTEARLKLKREEKARANERPPIERRMRCGRRCLYSLMGD